MANLRSALCVAVVMGLTVAVPPARADSPNLIVATNWVDNIGFGFPGNSFLWCSASGGYVTQTVATESGLEHTLTFDWNVYGFFGSGTGRARAVVYDAATYPGGTPLADTGVLSAYAPYAGYAFGSAQTATLTFTPAVTGLVVRFEGSTPVTGCTSYRSTPAASITNIALTHVTNVAPEVDAGADVSGSEGSAIGLDATVNDADGDVVSALWTYAAVSGVDAGTTCSFGDPSSVDTTITCTDDGTFTATLTASDGTSPDASDSATVTVSNAAPEITSITAPTAPVAIDSQVDVSAAFTDVGLNDAHGCTIDWGDGTTTTDDPVTGYDCTGSHSFPAAGVYTLAVTVTDDDLGSDSEIFEYVVVYDPDGGFVTGGGWIDSPEGAYVADSTAAGKASFGFVAKYKKGATVPDGNTQFQFKAGDLNFHSGSYEWLVVAGSDAKFKGAGTINGSGNYGFMISATDSAINGGGDSDAFRIKIWDIVTDVVVYDNQITADDDSNTATALGGGSIVIHTR